MEPKIIRLEERSDALGEKLHRVMRLFPGRQRSDTNLRCLLAFRLGIDGESATRKYVIQIIKEIIGCSYAKSFFDFIKDDRIKK